MVCTFSNPFGLSAPNYQVGRDCDHDQDADPLRCGKEKEAAPCSIRAEVFKHKADYRVSDKVDADRPAVFAAVGEDEEHDCKADEKSAFNKLHGEARKRFGNANVIREGDSQPTIIGNAVAASAEEAANAPEAVCKREKENAAAQQGHDIDLVYFLGEQSAQQRTDQASVEHETGCHICGERLGLKEMRPVDRVSGYKKKKQFSTKYHAQTRVTFKDNEIPDEKLFLFQHDECKDIRNDHPERYHKTVARNIMTEYMDKTMHMLTSIIGDST